jgi:hypothetical protein
LKSSPQLTLLKSQRQRVAKKDEKKVLTKEIKALKSEIEQEANAAPSTSEETMEVE